MASSRSPFKEQLVNRSQSVSPRRGPSLFLSVPNEEDQGNNESNHQDENFITSSYSYSPSKRSIGNNSLFSFQSTGRSHSMDASMIEAMRQHSIIGSSASGVEDDHDDTKAEHKEDHTDTGVEDDHDDTKAEHIEDQTVGGVEDHHDDTKAKHIEDHTVSAPVVRPSSCPPTHPARRPPKAPVSQERVIFTRQELVTSIRSSDNPFDGLLGSHDEIEHKPSAREIVEVETVTSENSIDDGISQTGYVRVGESEDIFDVTSEDILTLPSEGASAMEADVFRPSPRAEQVHTPEVFQVQNPFETHMQVQTPERKLDSFIFGQSLSDSPSRIFRPLPSGDDSMSFKTAREEGSESATLGNSAGEDCDHPSPDENKEADATTRGNNSDDEVVNDKLEDSMPPLNRESVSSSDIANDEDDSVKKRDIDTPHSDSSYVRKVFTEHAEEAPDEDRPSADNLGVRCASSDAFSGIDTLETESALEGLDLPSNEESAIDSVAGKAADSTGKTDDKSAAASCTTEDTYGLLASATDRTPKINNLEIPVQCLGPDPVTPPLTPKERYLMAIGKGLPNSAKEKAEMSPRDRYLLAIQQAATKCRTIVSSPTDPLASPNLTPKSCVKAQIKRVESELFRRSNSESPVKRSFIFSASEKSPRDDLKASELRSPLCCKRRDTADVLSASESPESLLRIPAPDASANCSDIAPSAFQSFHHTRSHSSSSAGELRVREQIDVGSGSSPIKSYLQLDLEGARSADNLQDEEHEDTRTNNEDPCTNNVDPCTNNVEPCTSNVASTLGPMDVLRSSLAVIWNSKPKPSILDLSHIEPRSLSTRKRPPEVQYDSLNSPATKTRKPSDQGATAKFDKNPPDCCEVPNEAGAGAMESLRSSLMMIWNSKPRPKLLGSTSSSPANLRCDSEPEQNLSSFSGRSTDLESHGLNSLSMSPKSCGDLPDCKRGRGFSEESELSLYRRTQRKKTRRSDGLSDYRQEPRARRSQGMLGNQYLSSSQSQRSESSERTVTPIPSEEDLYDAGLLGDRDSRRSYDSVDDILEAKGPPHPYQKTARYSSTPSPVRAAPTTETEESFINAALEARNVDDVVVIYSGTPDKRDWHPPEQERKEHDTMVRAILERPSLIDKSIRESREPSYRDWRQVRKWVLICLAMLLFLATIAGCLACGITGSCARRGMKDPTEEEEGAQPLVLNLPRYTQESLKSLHTAQTKAYNWLEGDPHRNSYSESRKMQRFALATLYFSTKIAQNWTVSTSWLSYDIHECYWFSAYEGMDVCENDEIRHLVLKKNNLRGNIPPEIALITSLVELDLSRNVLMGPIPEQLEALTSLEVLLLEKNELNGMIPSELSAMTNLTSLALATNDLKGSIPSEIGRLTNMQQLRLFYNYLTGPLPTEVGYLTNLELLDVDVNHLSGVIPTELGKLTELQELWLDWNNFVGPIPTELGMLSNLVKLYLGRAFVEDDLRYDDWRGSGDYVVPSELGQLTKLQELYLDNNNLTGMIPTELSSLTNLKRATLDNNLLTDSISPGICSLFGGDLESLSIDCAEVFCSCGCTCV